MTRREAELGMAIHRWWMLLQRKERALVKLRNRGKYAVADAVQSKWCRLVAENKLLKRSV